MRQKQQKYYLYATTKNLAAALKYEHRVDEELERRLRIEPQQTAETSTTEKIAY